MDNKLLLANCITLLFRESQLPGTHENSAALVRELITAIKVPEIDMGINTEREIIQGLKSTALSMCDAPAGHIFDTFEILQRLKINTLQDTDFYEAIRSGVESPLDDNQLKRFCLSIRSSLTAYFRERKVDEIINKASYRMKFERDKIGNVNQFVAEVCSSLEPYQVEAGKKDPAIISDVNMANLSDVSGVFNDVKNQAEGTTILRTGWQGVNRMLDGGFRRGEEWVFGALQHNYKTGTSLSVFMDTALFNVPVLTDPNKKPLLLRISCEDPLALNFQFMYERLRAMEGLPADNVTQLPPEAIAEYVQSRLFVNGYHTQFMHINPSMWTYRSICNKVLELEAEGYEVHMCMVDYILKIPTTGCDGKAAGEDIRNMYERLANFMKSHNVAFLTPHQLSTDAKMMIRDGRQDFVKQLVGRGYYAGCKQLDQVVDGELFMHIEKVNGKSYLTIQRGKHRKIGQTPDEHLYLVLEFGPHGILPDINGPDTSRKKVGGGVVGSGNEIPFWENIE
jgi:hypothetical protein